MKKINQYVVVIMVIIASTRVFASIPSDEQCHDINIQTLGAGGPEIDDGLASSSFLVWINGKARIMVDAGGGSTLNFEKSMANFNDLQAILLTHLHVDHSAAIPVYIKAGFFTGRKTHLAIFGPNAGAGFPSTTAFISALFDDKQNSAYPYLSDNIREQASTDYLVIPHNVSPENAVWQQALSKDLSIAAINVVHGPVPALAWKVIFKQCSVTFSGDMNGSSGHLVLLAKDTQLLVANNAIGQEAGRVAKNLHMTPKIIGEISQQANVHKLVLAHFMLRSVSKTDESRDIIKKSYSGEVELAKELEVIKLSSGDSGVEESMTD
ncbi:MBL fold metallo-hydrolase [Shewanella sp. VB17]|uniref:MBL fold metallo-hydrolase n=1 Tax=Shewanella sp. VB17 TaxID=2739432 RepID=UPI001563E650|nr:MBL fold metallo-hydrolase [Shewanella sp. VB17]NRD73679.1 MBL fold metallo-hydrolase [Shewanella sp. VB17]